MAKTLPPPFPRQVEWCVVYRDPERAMPERWRLYLARGSHHGASLAKSEAVIDHPTWEFRVAKRAMEWEWDD